MNKTFTKFKSKFFAAAAIALFSAMPAFAQLNFVAGPTANGTSGLNRAPNGSVDFQRTATIYKGTDFAGVGAGPINSIGFSINTPAASVASGTIKIYMVNTADVTYNRGTVWASILTTPSAMTLVYNGPLTIPTTTGFYNITLQTPFAFTGGNFYLAYEWNATTKSVASAVYDANADLAASLVTVTGATLTATDNLTGSSAFRPVLNLGVPAPANDMAVKALFVQGKMAKNGGGPQVIKALVRNNGASVITNRAITLNISGANTFTSVVTLGTLPAGKDSLISFAPFTPANLGTNNFAEVTVPADNVASNNSQDANIVVTAGTQGYGEYPTTVTGVPTITTALSGLYPTTAPTPTNRNSNFLVRFKSVNRTKVTVVRAYVPGAAFNPAVNTTGATVYGVVFNSAGVEVARSANVVLAAADVDKLVNFTLTTPAIFNNNDVYYVGMGLPVQPAATATIYAMGVQIEDNNAPRPGVFFASPVSTTAAVPTDMNDKYRFMIEADIVDVTGVKEELNAKLVSVYPNPSNGTFNVSATELKGGNTATVEVRDLQGKVVYTSSIAKNGAMVKLNNLAAGVYMMQISTDQQIAVKRLVIE